MKSSRVLRMLAAVASLTLTARLSAATLEEIEKAVDAQFAKINSATYDMSTTLDMAGQGYTNKSESTGKNEMLRDGAKWKMRMESKSSGSMTIAGNTTKSDTTSLVVVDGDFAYSMSDTGGQKSVMKMKGDVYAKSAGGKAMFDALRTSMDVAVLPDETVDGVAAYVLDLKPKQAAAGMKMKYYISKENGMPLQILSITEDGKPQMTTKMTNIKINPAIPADRFTFTPPAGVTVTDMTKE